MSERKSERKEVRDDPDIPVTAFVTVVGTILLAVLVVALQALFYRVEYGEQERKDASVPAQLRQVRAQQERKLGGYRWVDREGGIVAVPVERAMELVIRDEGRRSAERGASEP